jgi:hypothetical protein
MLCTVDLRTSPATFADDTAVLATDSDLAIADPKLQTSYLKSKTGVKNGD